MNQRIIKNHLSTETILTYISKKAPKEDIAGLKAHMEECEECAGRVDDYIIVKEHFNWIWDSWTAESHAHEVFKTHIIDSFSQADVEASVKEQAIAWAQKISQKTQAALGIVVDAPLKTARVFQEGMEAIFPSKALLPFSLVPLPSRVRGEGDDVSILVEAKGHPWLKYNIDPSAGKVVVRTELLDPPWPLVCLVPKSRGKAFIKEIEHPEDTDYLLAEFSDVPSGTYFILLEGKEKDEK